MQRLQLRLRSSVLSDSPELLYRRTKVALIRQCWQYSDGSQSSSAVQRCVLPVPAGSLLSRRSLLEGKQADAIHSQREKEPHLRADFNYTPSFWVGGGEVTDWVKVKSQEWEENNK